MALRLINELRSSDVKPVHPIKNPLCIDVTFESGERSSDDNPEHPDMNSHGTSVTENDGLMSIEERPVQKPG